MTIRKTKKAIIWPVDMAGAKKMQEALRLKARITPLKIPPKTVAGVDAAFFDDKMLAAATFYTYPDMALIEHSYAVAKLVFPYIPGYLSFREGPVVIKAIEGLKEVPDVIIFDGQGIAHPKGLGIATHIGILLDLPTIGCAKSRLVGLFEEPGLDKGCWSPLHYKERVVGAVLRSKDKTKPLFVSPGHKIDLKGATDLVLGCATSYRLPEPVRMADKMTKAIKQVIRLKAKG